jgi:Kdo2-lipid IVA lauroyltransferase/acyltransferase
MQIDQYFFFFIHLVHFCIPKNSNFFIFTHYINANVSMLIIKLLSKIPFVILYRFADLLYFFSCYVFKYRKKTVVENLKMAFPEKKPAEIHSITKGFYKNLADILIETIKGPGLSEKELKKRVRPVNLEAGDKYYDRNISFIAMFSHMSNWEWVGLACSVYLRAEVVGIYQQQANLTVDAWLKKARATFGAIPIEKKQVLRQLSLRRNRASGIGVIGDQSPAAGENRFWTTFLNQPTAFFTGGEKIAKKFDFPVVYVSMKRIYRGYYEMGFEVIAEPPYDIAENEILQRYVQRLETDIRLYPSNWLWSHNRWKLKKQVEG